MRWCFAKSSDMKERCKFRKNTTEICHTVSVTTLFSFALINNPQHFPIGLFIILWRKFHSWRKCFSIHWHLLQPHPSKLTEKTTCSLRNSSYLRRLGCQQMTYQINLEFSPLLRKEKNPRVLALWFVYIFLYHYILTFSTVVVCDSITNQFWRL